MSPRRSSSPPSRPRRPAAASGGWTRGATTSSRSGRPARPCWAVPVPSLLAWLPPAGARHLAYVLGPAFTAAAAVDALRKGQNQWLWIILFFPTIGAAIYFVSEYAVGSVPRFVSTLRPVSAREL